MRSRKLVRWFGRLAVVLTLLSVLLFVSDLWYDFLPSSLQTRLPLHPKDPIIVDIKIETCGLFSSCPTSSWPWVKLPKDLYLGTSWTQHAYIYVLTVKEDELAWSQEVLLQVAHSAHSSSLPEAVANEISREGVVEDNNVSPAMAAAALGWRDKGHGLWAKFGRHIPGSAVTNIKVLYTDSARYPLPGWYVAFGSLAIGTAEPRLAYKVGRSTSKAADPQLRFNGSGKLKIAQLSDLHMSTGWGTCDCPVPKLEPGQECIADQRSFDFLGKVLDEEKPDFVVFAGDQLDGLTAPDPETALIKSLAPVLERKLPFSLVWGNHDDEGSLNRTQLMDIVCDMPLFLGNAGPDRVPGVGNYVVNVAPSTEEYPVFSMYFIDSHSRLPHKIDDSQYDWIRPEQHDFLQLEAADIREQQQGYTGIPLSMAFFHIPLPEYRDELLGKGGDWGIVRIGDRREGVVAPTVNSGTLQVLRDIGVDVVSVGHDHVNDYCQLMQPPEGEESGNIWICYGGGSGEGGYGGYPDAAGLDFERRVRIYEVDMNAAAIDTWHRVQNHKDVYHRSRLVNGGSARYVANGVESTPTNEADLMMADAAIAESDADSDAHKA